MCRAASNARAASGSPDSGPIRIRFSQGIRVVGDPCSLPSNMLFSAGRPSAHMVRPLLNGRARTADEARSKEVFPVSTTALRALFLAAFTIPSAAGCAVESDLEDDEATALESELGTNEVVQAGTVLRVTASS